MSGDSGHGPIKKRPKIDPMQRITTVDISPQLTVKLTRRLGDTSNIVEIKVNKGTRILVNGTEM